MFSTVDAAGGGGEEVTGAAIVTTGVGVEASGAGGDGRDEAVVGLAFNVC